MTTQTAPLEQTYQGQFGEFTINKSDRNSVIVYRSGLMIAALSFAIGSALVLFYRQANIYPWLTLLYACFSIALGISLLTIHIYMVELHRLLQLFWLIGNITAVVLVLSRGLSLATTIYYQPLSILGIGFVFAALTGIFFKEAFCFNRLETKLLTPIVPLLLLGHLTGILPISVERTLLGIWAVLFLLFAIRKAVQAIPDDIGDKSVFTYLASQRSAKA
ncbi:MAG: DUF2301 domain-containing membrane protein [Mastigocoleus sp.]